MGGVGIGGNTFCGQTATASGAAICSTPRAVTATPTNRINPPDRQGEQIQKQGPSCSPGLQGPGDKQCGGDDQQQDSGDDANKDAASADGGRFCGLPRFWERNRVSYTYLLSFDDDQLGALALFTHSAAAPWRLRCGQRRRAGGAWPCGRAGREGQAVQRFLRCRDLTSATHRYVCCASI